MTLDFWGTLLHDGPGSDDRYRSRRLGDFARILADADIPVSARALARAYDESGTWLGRVWSTCRDVPVRDHVRTILAAVDEGLPDQLSNEVIAALIDAYARPALLVPPAVDPGALGALRALRERGYTLAVVSNTMRTPGATLRDLLERFQLLDCFAHTTFSDEVGVRKPDAAIFRLTLEKVGGEAAAAIHVGDDPLLDVHGARVAGMRVVQVTAGPPVAGGLYRPDATVPDLAALPNAIARLDG